MSRHGLKASAVNKGTRDFHIRLLGQLDATKAGTLSQDCAQEGGLPD